VAMVEVLSAELERLLLPYLTAVRKKIKGGWPTLDPELLLVHWLCKRNRLTPPPGPITRKGRLEAKLDDYGAERRNEAKLPASSPPPPGGGRAGSTTPSSSSDAAGATAPATATPLRPNSARSSSLRPLSALDAERRYLASIQDASLDDGGAAVENPQQGGRPGFGSGPSPSPSPPPQGHFAASSRPQSGRVYPPVRSSSSMEASSRRPPSGLGVARPFSSAESDRGASFYQTPRPLLSSRPCSRASGEMEEEPSSRPPMSSGFRGVAVEPVLRTLEPVVQRVEDDVDNHIARMEDMHAFKDGLAGTIMGIRQELRGSFLSKVPLLSIDVFTPDEQTKIIGRVRPWIFEEGDVIMQEEDVGDKLYVIEGGVCDVVKNVNGREVLICQLREGDVFGELAVIQDMQNSGTVRAASSVTVLSLSREDLHSIIGKDELKMQKLRIIARTEVFSNIPLLSSLTRPQKVFVAERMKSETWPSRAVLVQKGHFKRRLYIVESGTCVLKDDKGEAILHRGHYFGMLSLLHNSPMPCTITVQSNWVKTVSIGYDELMTSCEIGGGRRVGGRTRGIVEKRGTLFGNLAASTAHVHNQIEMFDTMKKAMRGHLVSQLPFLRKASEPTVHSVLDHSHEVKFSRGDKVMLKGAPLDGFYILEQGSLIELSGGADAYGDVFWNQDFSSLDAANNDLVSAEFAEEPRTLDQPGEFFGGVCLQSRFPQSDVTVLATSDCTMLRIPGNVARNVVHANSEERRLSMVEGYDGEGRLRQGCNTATLPERG